MLGIFSLLSPVRIVQFICVFAMLGITLVAGCDAAYGCDGFSQQLNGGCHANVQQFRQQVLVQPQVLYAQPFVQQQVVQHYVAPQQIVVQRVKQQAIVQRQVVRERNRFRLQLPVRREAVQKQVIIQQQIRGY